jgi:hypothetical protein
MRLIMIYFYKNFAKKQAGSVTLVVLSLAAFCTILLALFLRNAIDNVKYRQQMQFPAALKMEAYSFLDLALAFLGEYKQNANAEKMNKDEGNVNKGQGKLIFDSSILGENPSGTAIAQYISRKIGEKLANASLPEHFPAITIATPPTTPNAPCLKHGDFTIQYSFEDLSGKVPLCKNFLIRVTPVSVRRSPMTFPRLQWVLARKVIWGSSSIKIRCSPNGRR